MSISFLDYEIPRNHRHTPESNGSSGVVLSSYSNHGFWNDGLDSIESYTSRPSLSSAPGGVINPAFTGSDYYGK